MTPVQGGVCYKIRKEGFLKSPIFLYGLLLTCQFLSENGKDDQPAVPVVNYTISFILNRVSNVKKEHSDLMLKEGTQLLSLHVSTRQQAMLEHNQPTIPPVNLMCTRVRPDFPELQGKE